MRVAQHFAGYSLSEADNLRKAAGKKVREIMAKERAKFVEGCDKTGYGAALGTKIFDIIEPFADYAFNKSHSFGIFSMDGMKTLLRERRETASTDKHGDERGSNRAVRALDRSEPAALGRSIGWISSSDKGSTRPIATFRRTTARPEHESPPIPFDVRRSPPPY